jgi:hypothetical protein
MIRSHNSLSSLVFLCLSAFPNLASAQSASTLTDIQIAKQFSPIRCQIIKGRVDTSSPVNLGGERYSSYSVSGEPGSVMFAEYVNTASGKRTTDLSASLSFADRGSFTKQSVVPGFLPRLSWRFSEKYRTVSLSLVPSKIPSDHEVMIIWTRPSSALSESQVKKFAFSDPTEYADSIVRLASPENFASSVRNFLENSPIHRIDIKSMCNQVTPK